MSTTAVPPMGAYADLVALLAVVADPEAAATRLKALEAKRVEINALVEALEIGREVLALRSQASSDRETALGELTQAKAEAVRIIGTALVERDEALRARDAALADIPTARRALDECVHQTERDFAARRDDLDRQAESLVAREAAAAAAQAEAERLQADYTAKLARLTAAVADASAH